MELKNYVKDNRNGTITEIIKHKPCDVAAKGVVTMELTNVETGEVDYEVRSENAIMDWIGKSAYNNAFFGALSSTTNSGGTVGLLNPFYKIWLSDWSEEESQYCPMVFGRILGYADRYTEYAGTDTQKGTINKSETKSYINNEGKLVYSHVFDWPTHSCNGTFNSVFWTPFDSVSSNSSNALGEVWFYSGNLPSEFRAYMNKSYATWTVTYDNINDYINILGYSSVTESELPTNSYVGRSVLFTYKRKTGELISEITIRNEEGSPIVMYTGSSSGYYGYNTYNSASNYWNSPMNFKRLSDGRILNCFYDGSSFNFRLFNNEGILIKTTSLKQSDIKDSNDNSLSLSYAYRVDTREIRLNGEVWLFGYFRQSNGDIDNCIIVLDGINGTVKEIVNVNNKLYIPPKVEKPRQVKWGRYEQYNSLGKHTGGFSVWYRNSTDTSDSRYTLTMQTTDYKAFKYLAYGDRALNTTKVSDYDGAINGMSVSGISTWRTASRNGLPSAHTLLAAPVTKTQSHTMKVTYEIIADTVECFDYDKYFNK